MGGGGTSGMEGGKGKGTKHPIHFFPLFYRRTKLQNYLRQLGSLVLHIKSARIEGLLHFILHFQYYCYYGRALASFALLYFDVGTCTHWQLRFSLPRCRSSA